MRQPFARAPKRGAGGSAPWFRLVDIRHGELRVTLASFLVLFGGLAAHTMLETARDALFLARLSAYQLPWMYLALAAVAVLFTRTRAGSLATSTSLSNTWRGSAAARWSSSSRG